MVLLANFSWLAWKERKGRKEGRKARSEGRERGMRKEENSPKINDSTGVCAIYVSEDTEEERG